MDLKMLKALELTSEESGKVLLAPCLELVFYLEGPLERDLLEFHEQARELLGSRITHYIAEKMRRPLPLDARGNALLSTWLENLRPDKAYNAWFMGWDELKRGESAASLTYFLRNPPTPEIMKRYQNTLEMNRENHGVKGWPVKAALSSVRLTLPLDHPFASAPERFRDWTLGLRVLQSPQLRGGGAGLGIKGKSENYDGYDPIEQSNRLASILVNHPGLNWESFSSAVYGLRYWDVTLDGFAWRCKRVNWMTILPESILGRLGGLETLRSKLGDGFPITLHALAHGVVIQAGPETLAGDLARHDRVDLYRRVAEVLKGVRMLHHDEQLSDGAFDEDAAQEWLGALDEP